MNNLERAKNAYKKLSENNQEDTLLDFVTLIDEFTGEYYKVEKALNNKKIIVLAGNFYEYQDFVTKSGIPSSKFIYGDYAPKIMGVEAEKVIEVGNFYQRGDAYELRMLADSRVR